MERQQLSYEGELARGEGTGLSKAPMQLGVGGHGIPPAHRV